VALTITYPAGLPVSERRDDLLAAIGAHQVVIVAGETGSGKSTQLPKMCLELGRGADGKLIGHTQPRRLAARSIAERVASELGSELGATVGYTVRFTDKVSATTQIKVMTDGILLAEIQRDRLLHRYDTIIIDEAHERSLNVDFLLGYLKQLLPKRPDLKIIITSATIDTARFSAHFHDAPVIEVSGRSYPVEVRYRPIGDDESTRDDIDARDQVQAVCDAVEELSREGPGDVLVFFSGEREIHDAADALRKLNRPNTEILPLYARLSAAEQHRIFQSHSGTRIVLSTNVAETSLTVPGVRYVIDTGTARISRYSQRLKVQRLPIEPVSQASANQRAGRCGRVAAGVCIRLYSEDDFTARPMFTEPEILRTNLASVILQMTAIGLGDVAAFPFLDPPEARSIRDGVALLEELGALAADQPADQRRLTPLGRKLAQLPVDPRLARMIVEAERQGCVRDVLVIAAVLSIQDPRERPADKQQAADESHVRFRVAGSDFLAYVALWDYLRERQRELSSSQFRKLCRTEFFNYLRVREWQDLYSQLRQVAGTMGIRPRAGSDTHPDRVHQALLAGLLSHIGQRDTTGREFRGARNSKFAITQRSALAKKPPAWVMAGELVETNRLWARVAAAIQPEWAEHLAPHLVKRSYGEPRWDARGGRAVTTEKVTLYGLPIVNDRRIGYDQVDKALARTMFIEYALVDGEWNTPHRFLADNRAVLAEVQTLAERTRSGTFIGDEALAAFYDKRIGDDVTSARHFDTWWKKARAKNRDLLTLTIEDLIAPDAARLDPSDWPEVWRHDDLDLAVTHRFDPGQLGDGVTVHIPIDVLNRVRSEGFDWQVPGLRAELVGALIRALPKTYRRLLSPLADATELANERLGPVRDVSLTAALAPILSELAGEPIRASAFDLEAVPSHLRVTFSIDDANGTSVAQGYDLDGLRAQLSGRVRAAIAESISAAEPTIEQRGLTSWSFGALPKVVESSPDGHAVRGFPALLDDGGSVSIKVFSNADVQARLMPLGVRRLLLLAVPVGRASVARNLTTAAKLAITQQPTPLIALVDDCLTASADALLAQHGVPWDDDAFAVLVDAARRDLQSTATEALRGAARLLETAAAVRSKLDRLIAPTLRPSVIDAQAQLSRLVAPGFVSRAGVERLGDLNRYVHAIERRADTMGGNVTKDQNAMRSIRALENRYDQIVDKLPASRVTPEVRDVRWMLEELRVSVFAQVLGTSGPISEKRITRALDDLA
jgi:ATP-dependent helicase HrpA